MGGDLAVWGFLSNFAVGYGHCQIYRIVPACPGLGGSVRYMLVARGVTLYNLLVVAISGGIVFVPLWKKFIRNDKNKR